MRLSIVNAALVAVLVGFGSTIALVVSAAQALGATEAQTASWLAMICLATAASTAVLSIRYRIPSVAAWSTPGAALIVGTAGIGMAEAVGAFLAAAGLIVLTAAAKPLGRLVEKLPVAVAAAMLAGILLRFVLEVFVQAGVEPALVLPLVLLFLAVRAVSPSWAVIVVLIAGVLLARILGLAEDMALTLRMTEPVPVRPVFEPGVLIGLGLPLYLVTMAGQNLPGYAVLRSFGYAPPTRPILLVTGLASAATAPFGAHTANLSAITAAICCAPDAHPDPAKRWLTGPVYALGYLFLGLFAASFVALFASLPAALIATIAGLALISPLVVAAGSALRDETDRFAAIVTLAVTASGVSLLDTGSAFWGLLAGLTVLGLDRLKARLTRPGETAD
ncbi:MAG: benzoate/H(+) symporter BenE family transporter [Rhodospirillaceae bacterium]|nr:benzoate/H(+) symporter BenE family transporter [Rhodospirillaceae bacterium]MDE0619528.1 benzoate/H(+) symporter BenE family transporter [Rhodospirillaceae bacterium]